MRAALSRADLLRALGLSNGDEAVQVRHARCLGFEPEVDPDREREVRWPKGHGPGDSVDTDATATVASSGRFDTDRPALKATHFGVTAVTAAPEATAPPPQAAPLKPSDCQPRQRTGAPPARPLLRMTRLWPALRQSLVRPTPGGLDLRALTNAMAHARPVPRLPRRAFSTWGDRLWVVCDEGDAMRPYQRDVDQIIDQLIRQRGTSGLVLWTVRDLPEQVLSVDVARGAPPPVSAVSQAPAGTRVLLLSHLGVLARHPLVRERWLALARHLRSRGAEPLAWLPMSGRWVDVELAQALPAHCLQPRGHLRAQRGQPARAGAAVAQRATPQVEQLLTLAACCVHLSPELLRALRQLDPALRSEPGLEGLAWTHPLVGSSLLSRTLTPQGISVLRDGFDALPAPVQQQALATMRLVHQWRGRTTEATEALIWRSHARAEAVTPAIAAQCDEAQALFESLSASSGADAQAQGFAQDLMARQGRDERWLRGHAAILARVHALSGLDAVPIGLDPVAVQRARQRLRPLVPRLCRFLQRGNSLWLWPNDAEPPPRASPIGGLRSVTELAVVRRGAPARFVSAEQAPCQLADLTSTTTPVELHFEEDYVTVSAVPRPTWVDEWGRDAKGLYALTPLLGDHRQLFAVADTGTGHPFLLPGQDELNSEHLPMQEDGATAVFGIDRDFGVFVDLTLNEVTQRLRWIAPGEFWMGSTDEERGRIGDKTYEEWAKDESPRHRVRLTRGLWLADSACTQALWQAVMGDNPSNFMGDPQRPVEQVSWDDVQRFLGRLQPHLPAGCQAVLPTEAEWEYACRAGTDTAFNLGANITSEQVNYDGTESYAGGAKGVFRQETVPVKILPPSAWGLYQMHGNVWEWCDDGLRSYAESGRDGIVLNPTGSREQGPKAHRVVRGGSWFRPAGRARSASRRALQRVERTDDVGFRFALSLTNHETPGGLGRAARPEPEARGLALRDAGPARDGKGKSAPKKRKPKSSK